jgi:hypothetical protein
MALEYALNGEADLTTAQMLTFIAEATGGTIHGDHVSRDGLDVTAYREDPGDEGPAGDLLGFTHRVTAIFRFSNQATQQERDHNVVTMIRAVLAFFDQYPGGGALLFNDARVIVLRVDGNPVFDADWDKWTADLPELRNLVAAHPVRPLPQPLL